MKPLSFLAFLVAALLATGCGATLRQVEVTIPPATPVPASPPPRRDLSLTPSMLQVRLLAQISDAYNRDDLRTAYRLLQGLDQRSTVVQRYAEHLAALRRELLDRWSRQLLAQARQELEQHRFTGALARLEEVPEASPYHDEVLQLQEQIPRLETAYLRAREAALEQRDRRGSELLQRALQYGSRLEFAPAVTLLRRVPAGSSSYAEAQAKIGEYLRLQKRRDQWQSGQQRAASAAVVARQRNGPPPGTPAGKPKRDRPANWEQWRFQQWAALHRRYKNVSPLLSQPLPLLRPRPLWPAGIPR